MRRISCFIAVLLCSAQALHGQTDKLNQFWNEYAFTNGLSKEWSMELNFGLTTSSVSDDRNIFYNMTQLYLRGWAHYEPADRWKISFFYAYYYNKNVPELNQNEAPEVRLAVQVLYRLFRENRLKLNFRSRLEDRHLRNDDGFYEAVGRFRFQAKAVYPLTMTETEKDELYAFISDEVFFKTKSQVSGSEFFDRNRFTAGAGYFITSDIQIEISYASEIMPRKQTDQLVNAVQLNVIFNNFFPNLIKSLKPKKTILE